MLRVELEELIREVRLTLDENQVQSAYLSANRDNLELDELIAAKLPEAARDIIEQSPVDLLEPVAMPTTVNPNGGGGVMSVPDDFLRLVSVKLDGWNRSVTAVAGEGSDVELIQRNRWTRGTRTKPVCVYGHDADGKKRIEYFGTGSRVEHALYMPMPKVETDAGGTQWLSLSRLLRQATVRRTAGLVLLSRGEADMAGQFLS